MYKHGKPAKKINKKPLAIILAVLLLALGAGYYLFIARADSNTTFKNGAALTTVIKGGTTTTEVDEPLFKLSFPGDWKLTSKDWDARYHSYQWGDVDKKNYGASKWFRVYVGTVPADYAINYLLPVTANGPSLQLGQMSDNCVNFTDNASTTTDRPVYTPLSKAVLPSRWQQISFLCDNGNVSHHVVGIGSTEGNNQITLTGSKGTRKFFFLYQDNNIQADFGTFEAILSTFVAK